MCSEKGRLGQASCTTTTLQSSPIIARYSSMIFRVACLPAAATCSTRLSPQTTIRAALPALHRGLLTPTTPATRRNMSSLPADRRPLVISGPSGVGKGTLFGLLRARHPDVFTLSVSHTTRAPRDGEAHGVDYHFVTHPDFEALAAAGGFVEHAQFSGNRYGTSKATIGDQTAKGRVVVLDIEMEGVKQIKRSGMDARYVFVAPPSEEELEKRLRGRGTEKEESVLKRLAQAKKELEFAKTPGVHDLIVGGPAFRPSLLSGPCEGSLVRLLTSTFDRSSTMIWRRPTSNSRTLFTSRSMHSVTGPYTHQASADTTDQTLTNITATTVPDSGDMYTGRISKSQLAEQFICIPAGIKTRL